jgi:hypothetical protein
MLAHLKGASPWLRFIGILGFIGCGFAILGAIALLFLIPSLGTAMNEAWEAVPEMASYSDIFSGLFSGIALVYSVIYAVLLFFPSRFIYSFGSKIRSYFQNGSDQELEAAFKNNSSLWKYIGIIAIISLAFIPLLIIIGIIATAAVVIG